MFGGSTLTTTRRRCRRGLAFLGDHAKVAHLDACLIARTEARIAEMLEAAVERSRLSPEPLPVIVVGGGSILVKGKIGGLEVVKPHHFAVANAVGAAIAQVSGEIDRVYSLAAMTRADAINDARDKAPAIAVSAGARSGSIEVVDVEDVPLAYLPGNATRVHVKVVGDLMSRDAYPVREADLLPLALGAALLGTGGGGNPYIGMLRLRELLRPAMWSSVLPLEAMGDDDYVGSVGGIGAPVVGIEKIKQGEECLRALRAVEEAAGVKVSSLISAEIGGSNSIEPILTAAKAGLPVVDGDGMGRAFPEVQMSTFFIYGMDPSPGAIADDKGNVVVFRSSSTCTGSSGSRAMSLSTWARAQASRRRR